jgi:uncharacterized DUF497 family protein
MHEGTSHLCSKRSPGSTGTPETWKNAGSTACRSQIGALLRSDPGIAPDPDHSAQEDRFIAVGRNAAGRRLFVAFTFRMKDGQRLIRPVSARYMHTKEIEGYETESP